MVKKKGASNISQEDDEEAVKHHLNELEKEVKKNR